MKKLLAAGLAGALTLSAIAANAGRLEYEGTGLEQIELSQRKSTNREYLATEYLELANNAKKEGKSEDAKNLYKKAINEKCNSMKLEESAYADLIKKHKASKDSSDERMSTSHMLAYSYSGLKLEDIVLSNLIPSKKYMEEVLPLKSGQKLSEDKEIPLSELYRLAGMADKEKETYIKALDILKNRVIGLENRETPTPFIKAEGYARILVISERAGKLAEKYGLDEYLAFFSEKQKTYAPQLKDERVSKIYKGFNY